MRPHVSAFDVAARGMSAGSGRFVFDRRSRMNHCRAAGAAGLLIGGSPAGCFFFNHNLNLMKETTVNPTVTATAASPYTATSESNLHLLNEALRLAGLGLRIIPNWSPFPLLDHCSCRKRAKCRTPCKHPSILKWQELASSDPAQINKWWAKQPDANVGVLCGGRLLVIDVDVRGDIDGRLVLDRLEAEHGKLPKDWTVQTASGDGRHYYYWLPDDTELASCDKWREHGLEFRSAGKQVVCPPSRNASGQYEWLAQSGPLPPLLPETWIHFLKRIKPSSSNSRSKTNSDKSRAAAAKPDRVDLAQTYHGLTTNRTQPSHSPDKPDKQITRTQVIWLSGPNLPPTVQEQINEVVTKTYPHKTGTRNGCLVRLGQQLLAIRELREQDSEWFEPIIQSWLDLAEPRIGSRDLADSMAEWNYLWGTWLKTSFGNVLVKAREYMLTRSTPPLPEHGYRSAKARRTSRLVRSNAGHSSR